MAINTATTSDLEYAQNVIIARARFAMEHDPCMMGVAEKFTLQQGQKQITIPKFSALSDAQDLIDGVPISSSEDINMSYVSLTTSEIGIKVIVTDKLVRQCNEDVFDMVGRMLGASMARKLDKDGLAMLDGFSTSLGAAGTALALGHVSAAVSRLQAKPAPPPFVAVLHPYQTHKIMTSLAVAGTYPIPDGFSQDIIKKFWAGTLTVFNLPILSDGNLTIDSQDDAKGGVFSKSALAFVTSKEPYTERDRDIALRAWEIVHVCDADWVELNDDYGVEMYFDATAPSS